MVKRIDKLGRDEWYLTAADPRGKLPTVWVSATTARIPAGSIFFDADTGSAITFAADRDAVITVSGVGGLDASDTETVSTWYYLQAVWKDDGTYGAILSSSSGALGTAPTGYVNRAKLHAVYNNSDGNINEFTAIPEGGRWRVSSYPRAIIVITSTPATSITGLAVSGVSVPATAVAVSLGVLAGSGGEQWVLLYTSAVAVAETNTIFWLDYIHHKYLASSTAPDVPINPDGKIYYSALDGTNNEVIIWTAKWLE